MQFAVYDKPNKSNNLNNDQRLLQSLRYINVWKYKKAFHMLNSMLKNLIPIKLFLSSAKSHFQ